MTVLDSTTTERPAKPYPEFPLYAHKTRRWGAKIAGKTHFFGPWRDPFGSLARYMAEKEDLKAGKPRRASLTPPDASNLLTVEQMVILFLEAKKLNVQAGELSTRTWKEYESLGKRLIRVFGAKVAVVSLGPADFRRLRADFQKTHKALTSLKGDLAKSRLFFNWAGPAHMGSTLSTGHPTTGIPSKPRPASPGPRARGVGAGLHGPTDSRLAGQGPGPSRHAGHHLHGDQLRLRQHRLFPARHQQTRPERRLGQLRALLRTPPAVAIPSGQKPCRPSAKR